MFHTPVPVCRHVNVSLNSPMTYLISHQMVETVSEIKLDQIKGNFLKLPDLMGKINVVFYISCNALIRTF